MTWWWFHRLHMVVALVIVAAIFLPRTSDVSSQEARLTWTRLDVSGPVARWDHTIAGDDQNDRLILFGGRDGSGVPLGDTWLYDPGEQVWTLLEIPGPAPRFGHAVAVDSDRRALFLFGGQAGDQFFNDTWRFDLDKLEWTEVPTGEARPSPRYGTSAVLDSEGNLIVSHGFTFEGRFDDTWSLDPDSGVWSDISPAPGVRPLPRCLHEAVWDVSLQRMLLFGGCSSSFGPCPQGDLWAFDPVARAWTELTPPAGPAPRSNPALLSDATSGVIWLIDGLAGSGYTADLWTLAAREDSASWNEVLQGEAWPEPRASHDAVALDGVVYLFGGFGNAGALDDLWQLTNEV